MVECYLCGEVNYGIGTCPEGHRTSLTSSNKKCKDCKEKNGTKIDADKNEIIVGTKKHLIKKKIRLKNVNVITNNDKDFEKELFVKVRSTGKLLRAKVNLKDDFADVDLLEDEYGISPGQACVFYFKNKIGDRVLGGGWIDSNYL